MVKNITLCALYDKRQSKRHLGWKIWYLKPGNGLQKVDEVFKRKFSEYIGGMVVIGTIQCFSTFCVVKMPALDYKGAI